MLTPPSGDTETIPAGLDQMEPGPFLAAILEHTDLSVLAGDDRIVVLQAQQRMASHYNANVYEAMASVTEHMRELDDDFALATEAAAAEIRVALRLTRRATDSELGFALELKERLPSVWSALRAGDIDVRRAKTIAFHTIHLTAATAHNVVAKVIEQAPHLTTGQLAARLKKLCIEANPDEAQDRFERAVDERRVVANPNVDGTADVLGIALPPDRVARAMRRINRMARSLRSAGEPRTMDQIRADVFLDLLSGKGHAKHGKGPRGVLDMTVDIETLARLSDSPGELSGYGPVIADIARRVADESHDSEWRFTVADPNSAQPIHTGITQRRPNTSQRRQIETRDRTCVFPGCRMPATGCDVDHTIPYSEGGATSVTNSGSLCRWDHGVRHKHGWVYRRLENGDYQWTSKLGREYTTSGAPP